MNSIQYYPLELQRSMKLSLQDCNMNGYLTGTCTFSNGTWTLNNNGNSSGAVSLSSRDTIITRAGVKNRLRFSCSFDTSGGSIQKVGLFSPEFGIGVGYNGTSFGYFYQSGGRRFNCKCTMTGTISSLTVLPTFNCTGQNNANISFSGSVPPNIGTLMAGSALMTWNIGSNSSRGPYIAFMAEDTFQMMSYHEQPLILPTVTQGSGSAITLTNVGNTTLLPTVTWVPLNIVPTNYFEIVFSGDYDDVMINMFDTTSMTFNPIATIPASVLPTDFQELFQYSPFQAMISGTSGTSKILRVYSAECFTECATSLTIPSSINTAIATSRTLGGAGTTSTISCFSDSAIYGTLPPNGGAGIMLNTALNNIGMRGILFYILNPTSMDHTGYGTTTGYVGGIVGGNSTNNVTGGIILYCEGTDLATNIFSSIAKTYKLKHGDYVITLMSIISNPSGTGLVCDYYQET